MLELPTSLGSLPTERNRQKSRFFPSNFRFFRPTDLMRIYHKTKANHLSCTEKTQSSSKSLLQGSVIEIFLPVKDMNSQTIKRDQMFPESIHVNILHQRYNKLTPNTNCINIPCIENFKLLCQQNCKEVKTIFSDPSDRQLQKQA